MAFTGMREEYAMKSIKLVLVLVSVLSLGSACTMNPIMDTEENGMSYDNESLLYESESNEPSMDLVVNESKAILKSRSNSYPIVLVGGLGVWGRDEAFGIKYWGGLVDLQNELTNEGYTTYTSEVGPISSYWDRSCELYAQIKGTVVDYGAAHAKRYGHARYGRDYRGRALVKGWGTETAKVHLIGHSMGGPTIRAMTSLLAYGSSEDVSAAQAALAKGEIDPNNGTSTLFQGGQHLVSGVMTISSPHDGTTLTELSIPGAGNLKGLWVQKMVTSWISLWQGGNSFFDFKMDQWGITKDGKTWSEYVASINNSSLWTSTEDISSYDGTIEGAMKFNSWAKDDPYVTYFSWATRASKKGIFTSHQLPLFSTNPIWVVSGFSNHIGSFSGTLNGTQINSTWWPNDGVVNTISMKGPSIYTLPLAGKKISVIKTYSGSAEKGVWNYLGLNDTWDHSDIIGFTLTSVKSWYLNQANLLSTLEK